MSTSILFMFLTAFCATLLYVILKYFSKYDINQLQALTVNYITAGLFSFFLNIDKSINALPFLETIYLPCLGTGLLFILVFYTTALTAEKHGLTITSIAGKMSMVIPIIAGLIIYKEGITISKFTGIAIALFALYISNKQKGKEERFQLALLPLLVFIGSGLVDTSIKLSQYYLINDDNRQLYIACCFGSAGLFGSISSVYLYMKNNIRLKIRSVIAGIILGSVNYFSLAFLIKCLSIPGIESSNVFAVINMMVVILSVLFAILLFKEAPNKFKISGIILALAAIVILSF